MENLEKYFEKFRLNTVGHDVTFTSPYGTQKLIYADWIASGRMYAPIEYRMLNEFGPLVGNTHSESSETGVAMTLAYKHAHKIIKKHVNACDNDVIITTGSGMTAVVNKLQRILGLKIPDQASVVGSKITSKIKHYVNEMGNDKPIIFVTHMEHHSNHTSWLETIADVVVIEPDENLLVKPENLRRALENYKARTLKIGAFTAASNVTGIITPYYELAKIMHEHNGFAFIDFAASAPYVDMDMHPPDPLMKLDAIYFSPHKFLGGPGTAGVLVFDKALYKNQVPDQPGGGTVTWTNRWGEYHFINDVETREDGGTPSFLQTIRSALAIKLKEQMGTQNILKREHELCITAINELKKIPGLYVMAQNQTDRIGAISFFVQGVHHNLLVRLLNDRYGIQVRGGCSCAGTYGHFLLGVDIEKSHAITCKIDSGDLTEKPGWVRMSIHPTMTDNELNIITKAIKEIVENLNSWGQEYYFAPNSGEYFHKTFNNKNMNDVIPWFNID